MSETELTLAGDAQPSKYVQPALQNRRAFPDWMYAHQSCILGTDYNDINDDGPDTLPGLYPTHT